VDDDREERRRDSGRDRYEPLPGLADMPAFLWRRAGRIGRIAAIAVTLTLIGGAAALLHRAARRP